MLFDQEWLEREKNAENSRQRNQLKHIHSQIHMDAQRSGSKRQQQQQKKKRIGMEAMKKIAEEDNRMFGIRRNK